MNGKGIDGNIQHSTFNIEHRTCSAEIFVSRSDIRILARHKVAGIAKWESCPERTLEKLIVSIVLSGRDAIPEFPATAWLANFRRRFATKEWFLQGTSNIELPIADDRLGFFNEFLKKEISLARKRC